MIHLNIKNENYQEKESTESKGLGEIEVKCYLPCSQIITVLSVVFNCPSCPGDQEDAEPMTFLFALASTY